MAEDSKFKDCVLALAGIFQSALLVKQLAETGEVNEFTYLATINSIFKIDASDVASVFNGIEGVVLGLQELKKWCDKSYTYKNMDIN